MSAILRGPECGNQLASTDFSLADIRRFWLKFQVGGDGCWLWNAGRFENGYGRFKMGRKYLAAHRVAFALAHGYLPSGVVVMHSCDTPTCVRVSHLGLGSQAENVSDAMRKGRFHVSHPKKQRLTQAQVDEIRSSKESHRALAERMGVSATHVGLIRQGLKRQFPERISA